MKLVVECDNAQYYRIQAIMLIKEASNESITLNSPKYHDLLNQAMQLLALARLT